MIASLVWMNRGHDYAASRAAIERCRGRGFEICAHVMLGLPGETREMMLATARELATLGLHAIKLHNLYAVKNTPLADQVAARQVQLLSRDEYVQIAVDFLELLPPDCVVERTSGDAPPDYLVGPAWCLDKPGLRQGAGSRIRRAATPTRADILFPRPLLRRRCGRLS